MGRQPSACSLPPVPRSWTVSGPLRALDRAARALRSGAAIDSTAIQGGYDSWLEQYYGEQLRQIDAACAGAGPEAFTLFEVVDVDLWALLLTQQYTLYPNIRALLPDVPEPALQEIWNGNSGLALASQSSAFYRKLIERFHEHSPSPFRDCNVLDFGCGWGRLTRFLARDVRPGHLYGCDPVQEIVDVCRQTRLPAILSRSEFVPDRLPFEQQFEFAYSFSVFTHLSERAHLSCLRALHDALCPDAILVVTVRPLEYLNLCESMRPVRDAVEADATRRALYLFAAHPAPPMQAPDQSREPTYGETVITLPYVRERWSELFELLAVDLLLGDLHQVMLTLRRTRTGPPRWNT